MVYSPWCVEVLTKYPLHASSPQTTSGTDERTREYVLDGMKQVQQAFKDEDLIANVRLETYEGERYFHVPPPTEK